MHSSSYIEPMRRFRVPLHMKHARMLPFFLIVLAPAMAIAQAGPPFDPWRDSLQVFVERMHAQPQIDKTPAPPGDYLLVWTEHCGGGPSIITRGDTATLATFLSGHLQDGSMSQFGRGMHSGPVYFGDRYAYVGIELPTGLVRYTHWYFERKE